MAKFCSECGSASVKVTARFCTDCGAAFKEPVEADFSVDYDLVADPEPTSGIVRGDNAIGRSESAPPPAFPRVQSGISARSASTDGVPGQQSTPMQRSQSQSQPLGLLKSRYSNHPNCDLCNIAFDVTKRRHQCRRCGAFMCSACCPTRLLVPWGQQIQGARGYDKSLPQRVCVNCSTELLPLQNELVDQFARANQPNPHEPRGGRVHLPYTSSLATECQHAADILDNFFCDKWGAATDRSIPLAILQKAKGLAILSVVRAGFMWVGKIGTGLVVARLEDGSWSAPSAIGTLGLGWGLQIGGQLIEVVLVLGSDDAVQVFYKPQVNLGAGLDITLGPVGRSASAAGAVSSAGVNANFGYSHSRGLFAGIALQGTVIATRKDMNRKFYGREVEPSELLSGSVKAPAAAQTLYDALAHIDEDSDGE